MIKSFRLSRYNFSQGNLNLLQVQVDKKNSVEFLLDFVYYIYTNSNPNPTIMSYVSL